MSTLAQRLAEAVRHHEAGRLAQAEAGYRDVLRESPNQPHALHLLGVLAHQAGRHQEAADLIRQALTIHGPHPSFHSNLAAVYLATGDLAQAEAQARAALQLRPNSADALSNLGVALRRQGKLDEAETALRQAVRVNPRHVDALTNLGSVLQRQGRHAEAMPWLNEALRLAPDNPQVHNDLGGTLLAAGDLQRAARHLREAIRLRPDFAEAHSNLGLTLRDGNQIDESLACFREALRINPAYSTARNNLAYALESLGRIDEAVAEFLQVLRHEPANTMALASLCKLAVAGFHQLGDEHVAAMRELLARPDLPPGDRSRLHFALADLANKTGDYDEAFEHCRRGNELRKEFDRRGMAFDLQAERRLVDQLIGTCTPAFFERVKGFGVDSELPVFVVGMLRSGTTLAEQILASHPQVHGAGELPDVPRLASVGYPACLDRLDAATTRRLAEGHLRRLESLAKREAGQPPVTRVVDKAPLNFQHLGLIAALFPKARVIHCRRDPIDTCLSCFFQNFADPPSFTRDLTHLAEFYREYERLMAHWAAVLPLPVFELRYEELTAEQEATSRRLIAFCGLEWDDRCLNFTDTNRLVRTASVLQVRQPMYRTSVGRWRRYKKHLRPLLEALGVPQEESASS